MHLFVHCGPAIFVCETEGWSEPLGYCLRGYDVRIIEADVGRMGIDIYSQGNVPIEG